MSRGPGRIERAIEAAFGKQPKRSFTTDELCTLAYGIRPAQIAKKHRVAVLRACRNVCPRLWWGGYYMSGPGNMVMFVNQLDETAYLRGRVRARRWDWSAKEIAAWVEKQDDPYWANDWRTWKREHAIAVLRAAGDPKGDEMAKALHDERQQTIQVMLARYA
jgi:hypothetical protein